MSYGIEIESGVKLKCPHCNSIFAIENQNEILFRNITLMHFDVKKEKVEIKCKQCKEIIKADFINNRITNIK
jgi:hypothetical protein